jgi:hypothetical protein
MNKRLLTMADIRSANIVVIQKLARTAVAAQKPRQSIQSIGYLFPAASRA